MTYTRSKNPCLKQKMRSCDVWFIVPCIASKNKNDTLAGLRSVFICHQWKNMTFMQRKYLSFFVYKVWTQITRWMNGFKVKSTMKKRLECTRMNCWNNSQRLLLK